MDFALQSRTGGVPRVLDRRISNAGRLHDIRQRDPQQIFKTGGIQKFSMLGSQNAISYVPIAYQTKEMGTQTILPGQTRKDSGTGTGTGPDEPGTGTGPSKGLLGTTQSESSKTTMAIRKLMEDEKAKEQEAKKKEQEARKAAVEPSEKPPFDLSTSEGRKALEDYKAYLLQHYGEESGQIKADEITEDSQGFTAMFIAWRKIAKEIRAFKFDDTRQFLEWANNTVVEFGNDIVDALAFGASTIYPGSKIIINEISTAIKKFKPKNKEDFVAGMKELQNKLLEGRPEWKQKLGQIVSEAVNKFAEELDKEAGMEQITESFNEAMEAPKKKKNLKSVAPAAAPEPKTYAKTKEGVKEYKADHPKASQRAIAEALGIRKTTVLRYLK